MGEKPAGIGSPYEPSIHLSPSVCCGARRQTPRAMPPGAPSISRGGGGGKQRNCKKKCLAVDCAFIRWSVSISMGGDYRNDGCLSLDHFQPKATLATLLKPPPPLHSYSSLLSWRRRIFHSVKNPSKIFIWNESSDGSDGEAAEESLRVSL